MRTDADMPLPPAPLPFRWKSPDTLELRERSGCFVALFGAPFFLAGVFLFLSVIGVLPRQAEHESKWTPLLLGFMSLVFLGFGSVMLFGRRSLTLDLGRRSLIRQQGLLIPMHSETRLLSDFSAVALAYDPGDSESPVRYPVQLQAIQGREFVVSTPARFSESLRQAEFLSSVLRLPLVDATTDHRTIVAPERIGEGLKERLRSVNLEAEHVDRPPELRSEVSMAVGQTTIVFFGANVIPPVFIALGPVAAFLFVMPFLLRLLARGAPRGTGSAILTFLVLLVGVPALIRWFNRTFSHKIRRTMVKASSAGLVIERKHLLRISTIEVPTADILDVDCRSVEPALESAKNVYVNAMPLSQSIPQAQWIFTVLKRLVPSQGIIVKSRRELITFGEGLPEVELRYLLWILRRALAGG
jgi:hypothetical protein